MLEGSAIENFFENEEQSDQAMDEQPQAAEVPVDKPVGQPPAEMPPPPEATHTKSNEQDADNETDEAALLAKRRRSSHIDEMDLEEARRSYERKQHALEERQKERSTMGRGAFIRKRIKAFNDTADTILQMRELVEKTKEVLEARLAQLREKRRVENEQQQRAAQPANHYNVNPPNQV